VAIGRILPSGDCCFPQFLQDSYEIVPIRRRFDGAARCGGGQESAHFLHEIDSHFGPGFEGLEARPQRRIKLRFPAFVLEGSGINYYYPYRL
jgi:hypothetical protein